MPEQLPTRTLDTVQRQLAILGRIPRQPRQVRASDVHASLQQEGLEVTIRTIQRDLINLARQFPIGTDKRRGQDGAVWFWLENGPGFEAPGMDPSTALALLAARDHLKPLLPAVTTQQLGPYFRRAEQTLNQIPGAKLNVWRRKVRVLQRGPQLAAPIVNASIQLAVEEALLTGRKLNALYQGRGASTPREQALNPLALVSKDGVQYLVATVGSHENPVHYALHRFKRAQLLPEPSKSPGGFSLDAYLEHQKAFSYPESPNRLELELAVVESLAFHLQERPLGKDQKQSARDDGRIQIKVTTHDTAELRWWLMGFGDQVEVVAPESLRDEMRTNLRAAAARYQESRSTKTTE